MRMTRVLAGAALALLAAPVFAATPTARVVGGDIPVRLGPGAHYKVIGTLANGSRVALDYCTHDGRWCLVAPDRGWVRASYLVGSAAKIAATPFSFQVDPFGWDKPPKHKDD